MTLPDIHLDLGCGTKPRNPYGRQRLCGVDIRGISPSEGFEFRAANLSLERIPFDSDTFGSVSAFDFLEHVPRILTTPDGKDTYFPFIGLMNDIWRVLAPGGTLYALTPAFPIPEAFVDPTHVNIITDRTHHYFCGEAPLARMYGFHGRFAVRRAQWVHHHEALVAATATRTADAHIALKERYSPPLKRAARNVRETLRFLRGKRSWSLPLERYSHFLWELEAQKP